MSDIRLPRIKVQLDYDPVYDRHRIIVRCHGDKDLWKPAAIRYRTTQSFGGRLLAGMSKALRSQQNGWRRSNLNRT